MENTYDTSKTYKTKDGFTVRLLHAVPDYNGHLPVVRESGGWSGRYGVVQASDLTVEIEVDCHVNVYVYEDDSGLVCGSLEEARGRAYPARKYITIHIKPDGTWEEVQ